MANAINAVVQKKLREDDASEAEKVLVSYMMGTALPALPKRQPTPTAKHVFKMTNGYLEILTAAEFLEIITKYLNNVLSRPRGISKPQHMRIHFEWHLNEFYILACRLDNFMKTVERSYRQERLVC